VVEIRKTLLLASNELNKGGISHALIGGFALAVYGNNRATADIDLPQELKRKKNIKIY
jgi:hypothetical protein